jgi:hypothetical protein
MKVRLKKLDIIFSQLVRERNNYYCQNCCENKRFEGQLDCAHIMGRRGVGLRWHPCNATALCGACHRFYTEHPFDWADWCKDQFGEDFVVELRLVSSKPVKWSKGLREEIYQHYKKELKEMEAKRLYTNHVIDFKPHEVMHTFEKG